MSKKIDFAVSTLAFSGETPERIIEIAENNGLAIEFSSGLPPRGDMAQLYLLAKIRRYPHNYFPAPRIPFVLNLASGNEKIRNRSIDHCLQGLELANKSGAPFFSAHAGFCIDPDPSQLGKQLQVHTSFERQHHWSLFLDALARIDARGKELGVKFLVENNVLARFNTRPDGVNPLFCCDPEEISLLFSQVVSPQLGLLLDTAHLKVSAGTLGFDQHKAVQTVRQYVECIHHSDNDGMTDDNMPIRADYWFLRHMEVFAAKLHVLEVRNQDLAQIAAQRNLLESAANA